MMDRTESVFTCQKCGSKNNRIYVQVLGYLDGKHFRQLKKKTLSSKDFEVWGVDWDGGVICSDCGHLIDAGTKARKTEADSKSEKK